MGERARRSAFATQKDAGEVLRGFLTLAPAPTQTLPEEGNESPSEPDENLSIAIEEPTTAHTISDPLPSEVDVARVESTPSSAPPAPAESSRSVSGTDTETAAPWVVTLPSFRTPSVRNAEVEELLAGPLRTVPLVLPVPIANALQEYALRLAIEGQKVSRQTLVAHGLAFAYTRPREWLGRVPADSRRTSGLAELTRGARKTTFRLPETLEKTTLALMLRALKGREDQAASRLSFTATALAFALNRAGEWVEAAVANPVR